MQETFDASQMRALNSSILLKLIWRNQEISRADISRMTGMSRSTVSAIVSDLMQRGLVTERGVGHSNGGRRPVILAFCEDAYSVLGIELTPQGICAAVTNLNGKVQKWMQRDCAVAQDPQGTLEHLRSLLAETLSFAEKEGRPLIGIGMGLPLPYAAGPEARSMVLKAFPQWQHCPVHEIFQAEAPVPVFIENDANLGAVAELCWGKSRQNLAFLKMGSGIGAGLIIDGKMFRGLQGFAGEVGYTSFHAPDLGRNFRLCDLLARYLNVEMLAEEAAALGMVWADSRLARKKLSFANLCQAAEEGDFLAQHALQGIARGLGVAVANLLHILNLDSVVLGGHLAGVSDAFLQQVESTLREHAAWPEIANTPIERSLLGEQQVAVGAATLLLEKAMDDLSFFPTLTVAVSMPTAEYWPSYERTLHTM